MPNLIFQNNLQSINSNDVLVASFPRSGNTWLRLLISDVILQIHGFETNTKLPVSIDDIIPDIYQHNVNEISNSIKLSNRLIKTHELYNKHKEIQQVVYIFRQPADALCSYYDFLRSHNIVSRTEDKALFVLEKVDQWLEHLLSYGYAKQKDPSKILFISYEGLHNNPALCLEKVFDFLKIDGVDHEMYLKAVNNHAFDNHKKLELKNRNKEKENYFYRRGKVNSSMDELADHILLKVREKTQDVLELAKNLEVPM
ncbi:sulfotransferase domain-containing protein [Microcoleus sp. K1-B6]|uniref:sulfotransferase domain-containing protein n=1 Tax=unclassified Microcoleus TaxID=2642155 RepID=UPI002FD397D0